MQVGDIKLNQAINLVPPAYADRFITPFSSGLLGFGSNAQPLGLSMGSGLVMVGSTINVSQSLQTQSNIQGISAGTQIAQTGNVVFSNGNGMSFGMAGNSVITASYTVPSIAGLLSAVNFSASNGSANLSNIVFANGNGVSFGLVGSTLTASVSAGGGVAVSAGANSQSTGTVVFSNSNSITFGLSANGVMTASFSYTVPVVTNSSWSVSDGATSGTVGRLAFTNLNGVTLSLSTGAGGLHTIVGSHNALTSQSNQAFSASGGSSAFQTLNFGNANGLTFSNNNGSVVGSYTVPVVTNSSWSVSDAATSGTVGRIAFTNLNGVTLSLSTGAGGSHTIVGSHNALTSQSNQAFSASGGSSAFQTLNFGNSNGLTFSNSNGSVIGSYTVPSVAGLISAVNFSAGTTSGNLAAITFSNANGLAFGLAGGTLTGSYTVPSTVGLLSAVNISAGATSNNLSAVTFANGNGVSFGMVGSVITASVAAAGGAQTGISGISAGTTQMTSGTAVFSNANNFTFGVAGNTLTASYSQSNQQITLFAGSNTTQGTSGTFGANSILFAGAGVASVGLSNGSVVISVPAGGVALGTNTFGISNLGNTAGTSGVITGAAVQFLFAGGNNVTLSQSILLSSATITISAANQTAQTQNVVVPSAGTQTATSGTAIFSNGNNVSFGMSNSSVITASAVVNVSAGTTSGNVSAWTYSNGNNVSFGLNNGTITASVVPPLTLSSYEPLGIFGLSTVVLPAVTAGTSTNVAVVPFVLNNYVSVGMMKMLASASFQTLGTSSGSQTAGLFVGLYTQGTGANSTALFSLTINSFSYQVSGNNSSYSINQVTATNYTGFGATAQTNSAGSNITSGYTGMKFLNFPINSLLSPGNYWLAYLGTVSTSSINVGMTFNFVAQNNPFITSGGAPIGSYSSDHGRGNLDNLGGRWNLGHGLWSSAGSVTALPASMAFTSISIANIGLGLPMLSFWST